MAVAYRVYLAAEHWTPGGRERNAQERVPAVEMPLRGGRGKVDT